MIDLLKKLNEVKIVNEYKEPAYLEDLTKLAQNAIPKKTLLWLDAQLQDLDAEAYTEGESSGESRSGSSYGYTLKMAMDLIAPIEKSVQPSIRKAIATYIKDLLNGAFRNGYDAMRG